MFTGKLGDAAALPHVLRCMRDSDERCKAAAAATLHQLQGASALAALVEIGLPSESEPVQRGSVASLARWRDGASVHAALKAGGIFGKPPKGHTKQRWADVRAAGCEVLGHLFFREVGASFDAPTI